MIFLPDAENRTIVYSFVWTKHRNVTDGQTDRQTESLWLLGGLHYELCGRAVKTKSDRKYRPCNRLVINGIHKCVVKFCKSISIMSGGDDPLCLLLGRHWFSQVCLSLRLVVVN